MTVDDMEQWLSVSDLAKARGVSRQAISQGIRQFSDRGTPIATRRNGQRVLVNAAEFDRAARERPMVSTNSDLNYSREQARKIGFEAELKRLELEERQGRLLPAEAVRNAAVTCGEEMVRAIGLIVNQAEQIYAAAKDGVSGTRAALRAIARDLCKHSAEQFAKLANAEGDSNNE